MYATDFEEADISCFKKLVPWAKDSRELKIYNISTYINRKREYSEKSRWKWFLKKSQKEVD